VDIIDTIEGLSQDLSPKQRIDLVNEALRDEFRASLYYTARVLCNFKDINRRTHSGVIDALEANTPRKLVVMPRGSLKSSICSVAYPIWLILRNPNIRILISSEIYTNSKNFLREIRSHLENPEITEVFGDFKSPTTWSESEIIVNQRTKTLKEATITCGGVGTVKVGQHYDVIIHDDLNSLNNSLTKEGCEKVINYYKMSISLLEPNGSLVIVGTRYSASDCIGHIIRSEISDEQRKKLNLKNV